MRKFIIALSLILCAPAFAAGPKAKPTDVEIANCKKMADYGKGIASLKETGVTIDQFASYITEPKVQTFPIRTVSKYVYELNSTPDQVYQQLFDNCIITGYSKQLAYFQREQEIADLQKQNQELIVENAALQARVLELSTAVAPKKAVRKP
jgi:hypothetical protein